MDGWMEKKDVTFVVVVFFSKIFLNEITRNQKKDNLLIFRLKKLKKKSSIDLYI